MRCLSERVIEGVVRGKPPIIDSIADIQAEMIHDDINPNDIKQTSSRTHHMHDVIGERQRRRDDFSSARLK